MQQAPLVVPSVQSYGRIATHRSAGQAYHHEFLMGLFEMETMCREKKDYERRLSAARLPQRHDLNLYDFNFAEGIPQYQLKKFR